MDALAVIPARYASTRLPAKPLLNETGKPLIQHVVEQVRRARRVRRCLVATDDERIAAAVRAFGGEAVMTRPDHPSGTDRIAEAVRGLSGGDDSGADLSGAGLSGADDDLILNVQGDEPEIDPDHLDRLVERLDRSRDCAMATLACPFPAGLDPRDPNAVKVVLNNRGEALYFSRALIPWPRPDGPAQPASDGSVDPSNVGTAAGWLLHLGVYAYRRSFLLELTGWPPGRLEQIEKLEQLRVLEAGRAIAVEVAPTAARGIDTPADYAAFVRRLCEKPGG